MRHELRSQADCLCFCSAADGNGGDSADLKLTRVARSPDPNSSGANTKESAIQSWKAALGIKAKSNTKHLDRSVR